MKFGHVFSAIVSYKDELFGLRGLTDEQRVKNRAEASAAATIARHGVKPLPESVIQLLTVLRDPMFRVHNAIAAVEADPALTGQIIHLANSAAHARRAPCDTVAKAFGRLGTRAVGDVAIAAHVMALGASATGISREVVDHSVRVATIVRGLPAFRGYSPERLFLCGLVHDIGITLLDQSGEFTYSDSDGEDLCIAERKRLGFDHATLGAMAMKMWDVPDPVSRIVAWHHDLDLALERRGDVAHMVATLRLAEVIEKLVGPANIMTHVTATNIAERRVARFLGLTGEDLLLLWESSICDDLRFTRTLAAAA